MGFKEVSSLDAEVTVALGKINKETGKPFPKQAEGYFLGSRTVESKKGESKLHFLQTAKGNLGVWGTTDLNRKLQAVPAGTMVRITSTGQKPTPNGDMYTYRVEVDSENTINVNMPDSNGVSQDDSFSASSDSEEYNADAEADEVSAAELAAAKKAKAQEILARAKKTKSN